jgi:hypothetical protein
VTLIQDLATSTIHPIGESAQAGPWTITVAEVLAGDEASSFLLETNAENPAAPEGYSYVLARIVAQNTSDRTHAIQMTDFAATGSDGVLRRTQAVVMPDPMLQSVVAAGESTEGWIAPIVDDVTNMVLWFDSPFLGGNWASALFALSDGASLGDPGDLDASDSDLGSEPTAPATIGDTVKVGGWEITITEVIDGNTAFEMSDFRFRALGSNDSWVQRSVGLHATVRNLNPFPAFFSPITFEIADQNGEVWDHTLTMTGPEPDVSREYLPGASGDGWATLSPGDFAELHLIKVAPFKVGGAARYISFDPEALAAAQANPDTGEDEEEEPSAAPLEAATGDTVVTTEDLVNLRDAPSTTGTIIRELPLGTELVITGEATEADGYTWWPVDVTETEESGYVVADFLAPA